MTKEELQNWNRLRDAKREFQAELDELQQLLRDEPDYPYRKFVEDDIAHDKKIIAMIGKWIPDWGPDAQRSLIERSDVIHRLRLEESDESGSVLADGRAVCEVEAASSDRHARQASRR